LGLRREHRERIIRAMQRLRHASFLARLVLAWFALALGVAVASPIVKPQAAELVCSGSGAMHLVVPTGDEGQPPATHTFDCPLCAAVAPPPPVLEPVSFLQPLGHVMQSVPAARLAARIAPALPARGPPLAS
jgi:hypothetical protein